MLNAFSEISQWHQSVQATLSFVIIELQISVWKSSNKREAQVLWQRKFSNPWWFAYSTASVNTAWNYKWHDWLVRLLYGNYCAFLAQPCTHNVLCRGWLRKPSNLMKQNKKTKTERSLLSSVFIEMPIKPIPCDISALSFLLKKLKLLCMSSHTSGGLITTKR